MPTALVTGIAGQTGSYLAEQLTAEGWQVHGLIRDRDAAVTALTGMLPDAVLHEGDLRDGDRLAGLIARTAPDAVFHLGGLSSVAASWHEPVEAARVTAMPTAVMLEASWRLQESSGRPIAFVFASSAEIFGDAETSPQDEDTRIAPTNPYGAAKAYGHQLVGVYRGRGLAASSCILYNHESPRRPPTFVTRKITRGAARIALGLDSTLVLGNLDARRDWGWAPDYADALRRSADQPGDYVIATGVSHSVRDFVSAAFAAAGVDDGEAHLRTDDALQRVGDAAMQVGDASRAREILAWGPTKDFDEIVGAMIEADLAEAAAG